jgi:hypothetical protein
VPRYGDQTTKQKAEIEKTRRVASQRATSCAPIDTSHRKELGGGLHSLIFFDLVNDFARALIRKIT